MTTTIHSLTSTRRAHRQSIDNNTQYYNMAGIPIAFNDVLHQYSGSQHKRFKMKRQGRDPLSQPGVDSPSSTTDTGNSLSLGRPSDTTPTPTDDGTGDEDTSSSERECCFYCLPLHSLPPLQRMGSAWAPCCCCKETRAMGLTARDGTCRPSSFKHLVTQRTAY